MEERTIDGRLYQFHQLSPKESLRTLTRLYKILGQPIAMGMAAFMGTQQEKSKQKKGADPLKGLDTDMLTRAVAVMAEKMDEDVVINLIENLCASDHCLCDGVRVTTLEHYSGELGHMFKVLAAALEVQYGNFLGVLLDLKGLPSIASTLAQRT